MDQVASVREKVDIVSLIGEYITLKKMGANFKAPCPFHNEKSPSFVVSPERQIWHCFGCNRGGDCFTFLMEYEHLEFAEALRFLAKRTGVDLGETKYQTGISSKKELIYTLNMLSLEFYHYILLKHPAAKNALDYVTEKRKITPKVLETFKVGFSPVSGNVLSQYLTQKKGYKPQDLVDAGLSVERYGRLSDFFSNRLMFPLIDHRDNVVGFAGRIMTDGNIAKYVNTRETLVYHKGSHFFGINIAKQEIKQENRAIIVEGEFDVLSSFQEGIGNTIAVKGTALTDDHVALLSRFTQKVSLCFDQDSAGQEAIRRSLVPLEKRNMTTTVIIVPGGKDADEVLHTNPTAYKLAVKNDIPIYDFLISQALEKNDVQTADGKKKVSNAILPLLASIENAIVKEHYVRKISRDLSTSFESVLKQLENYEKKESPLVATELPKEKKDREEVLEQYLLSLVLQSENPKELFEKEKSILDQMTFKNPACEQIYKTFYNYVVTHPHFDAKVFVGSLANELHNAFDTSYLFPLPKFEDITFYLAEVSRVARELVILKIHKKLKLLGNQIQAGEKAGGDLHTLEDEFAILTQRLSSLQGIK